MPNSIHPNGNHWGYWVNVVIAFNWDEETADITFTDLYTPEQAPDTYNVDLILNKSVVSIEIAHYGTKYNGFDPSGPQGDGMHFWVNNLQYWYTVN